MDNYVRVKESILSMVPADAERALIDQIEIARENGTVKVLCPSLFAQRHLTRNYKDLIIESIRSSYNCPVSVDFGVQPAEKRKAAPVNICRPVQMSLPVPKESQCCTGLDARFTFDDFVVGRCNSFAFEAANAVSEGDAGKYNPLFFYSDIGLGKSHISHSIGNKVVGHKPNVKVKYTTSREFAQDYIISIRNNSIDTFKSKYHSSNLDIFFIDDVHLFKNKTKTQMELCHVIDDLMSSGKQVILSGFRPPSSMPQIESGLKSRFSSGLIIDLKRPDNRTRSKMVRHKAAKSGVILPDDVVEFISNHVHSSIRELESAVMTITAMSSLMKKDINLDLAKELLEGTLDRQQKINIAYIQDFVSKNFNITMDKLISSSRKKEILYPRQIAIFLCRRYTQEPLQNIGDSFNRKHSSVIHSLETIENKYSQNLKIKRDIDFLIEKLDNEMS